MIHASVMPFFLFSFDFHHDHHLIVDFLTSLTGICICQLSVAFHDKYQNCKYEKIQHHHRLFFSPLRDRGPRTQSRHTTFSDYKYIRFKFQHLHI